jgi:hypothetical protein
MHGKKKENKAHTKTAPDFAVKKHKIIPRSYCLSAIMLCSIYFELLLLTASIVLVGG